MVDFENKIEDNLSLLNSEQIDVCRILLHQLGIADKKFFNQQSELVVNKEYLEFIAIHSNDCDSNFVIIFFNSFIEFSCLGFCFQFDYNEKYITEYILSLFNGEYKVIQTTLGNSILKTQFIWNNKNLKSRITKHFLYNFRFLFNFGMIEYKEFKPLSFISST